MKLSSSICISILSSLAVSKVSALVIPDLDAIPNSVAKVANSLNVATENLNIPSTQDANALDFSSVQLLSEEEALPLEFNKNAIPNSVIITFNDNVTDDEIKFHQLWISDAQAQSFSKLNAFELDTFQESIQVHNFSSINGGIKHSYNYPGFKGYSGLFTSEVINLLRRSKDIKSIELDSTVEATKATTQDGAPWGLSRISHRKTLRLGNYNQYLYDNNAGEGVTAYVIDTGINIDHEQFEGRAVWGATIPAGDSDVDGNGHGTHCAGTIGSKDYGVSKKAKIVAVKVLKTNGSGTMSDVVKGVEFAANSHLSEVKQRKAGFKGSTANMSLGGGKSPALDMAVNAAVKAGLHFAVAAGNDNADACNYSPAAAENAITVGASTLSDARAYFSNFGKCVDIFGPGLNILSTYIGSDTATAILSGTSMASPHVCGLLTYFLSLAPTSDSMFSTATITPKQLKQNIIKFGTKNALSDIPEDGTPNNLIFNGAGGDISGFWNFEENDTASHPEDLQRTIDIASEFAEEQLKETKAEISNLINDIVHEVQKVISV